MSLKNIPVIKLFTENQLKVLFLLSSYLQMSHSTATSQTLVNKVRTKFETNANFTFYFCVSIFSQNFKAVENEFSPG